MIFFFSDNCIEGRKLERVPFSAPRNEDGG